eukprot:4662288-Pleurochrysis_carterae.AAC.2
MQQMRTRDKAFRESILRLTRKEQSANTAPSVTLDDLSRVVRGREGGGRGASNYAAGQSQQDRLKDGCDRLNDMEPIPPKDLPNEIRDALESANIKGDAYYKAKPCHVCGKPGHPTSKWNRLYVLTPEGRRKHQALYERVDGCPDRREARF